MAQVLYRKYRSRSLDEIVGQEHITETLKHALKSGKISHAYLLTGPRGTGKTSIARIIAHEINNLSYTEDSHFDIIEIDAASNNGVEDIRDLREKVQSAPTSAKYKVYIIDEVHMLSKAAFNALLKTLEEPPEHVVFILATTEVHKLPETIISRTQRFSLRPVPISKVKAHLKNIATTEKINVDDEALQLIAEHGEGSFRDSIGLLDQARSTKGKITTENIESLLGRAPGIVIKELLLHVENGESASVASDLEEMYTQGYEAGMIASQLSKHLRKNLVLNDTKFSSIELLEILKKLIDVSASPRPSQLLELILLSQAISMQNSTQGNRNLESNHTDSTIAPNNPIDNETDETIPFTNQNLENNNTDFSDTEKPTFAAIESLNTISTEPTKVSKQEEINDDKQVVVSNPLNDTTDSEASIDELWHEVLQTIKQSHNTLYGIARMAKPSLNDGTLTLKTKFSFHQKRLNEVKNKNILIQCVSKLRGQQTNVLCEVDSENTNIPSDTLTKDISAITNIFGGAELL